jgi:hypothetical protein
MSFQLTTAFVDQFGANLQLLSQQKGSRLRALVDSETVKGEQAFFDQLGPTVARLRTTRHADSPVVSTPHARRRVTMGDYDWGDLIDGVDKIRTLIDPESGYVKSGSFALGRSMDDVVIEAATGTAYTGPKGLTPVVLPNTQIVGVQVGVTPAANTGLNVGKLIAAKSKFGKNEVEYNEGDLVMVVTQQQLDDLLNITAVTSADYNTVRALVKGEIDTFMGFKFVRTQRCLLDTATDFRTCFAFVKDGIRIGLGQDIQSRVTERADKCFSWYAYACMTLGATRMEEAKVVSILCDESP